METSLETCSVVVVGGGLAGLTAAIELSLQGISVILVEKKKFPRHKVCGEYVSNEVLPILNHFELDPFLSGAQQMKRFVLSSPSGNFIESKLPLGAFSLSRYKLDELLYKKAITTGVKVYQGLQADKIEHVENSWLVSAGRFVFKAQFVISAYGKSGKLKTMRTANTSKMGRYFAVKRHIETLFPDDLVALHNFSGGYCGVSRIEEGKVNICYLAQSSDLKRFGSIDSFENNVLFRNPHLKKVIQNSKPLFARPMAISNFELGARQSVQSGVFLAGDAAGMISPLCGNGMAMAFVSGFKLAQILSECINRNKSVVWAEVAYSEFWTNQFSKRLKWGETLQFLFGKPIFSNIALSVLKTIPSITPKIIENTHGNAVLA